MISSMKRHFLDASDVSCCSLLLYIRRKVKLWNVKKYGVAGSLSSKISIQFKKVNKSIKLNEVKIRCAIVTKPQYCQNSALMSY